MLMLKYTARRDKVEMWIPVEAVPGPDLFIVHGYVSRLAFEKIRAHGAGAEFRSAATGVFHLFRLRGNSQSESSSWNFGNGFRAYDTPEDFLDHLEILGQDQPRSTGQDPGSIRPTAVLPLADSIRTLDQILPGKSKLVRFRSGIARSVHRQGLQRRPVWA